ncbi:uncharacterized protein [Nicotiana tomentosiformis]|uniref:uncharacterized protein n=1 Tax=Nicotiana tomentosiformis TaxID=4098 RepID=UPI00388CABAA
MGKLASAQNTRPVEALLSDTKANPKASINDVSLRNGRQLEKVPSKKRKQHVQINILLVDIFQEVPKYAKHIKDIVANKRRLANFETTTLTEECSSRIQSKLPQKLKDPSSFTIQISIGVIQDVLVYVGSFIFPTDFIILEYEPDQEVPLILGRPFLATGQAIIDVFKVYKALILPAHYEEISMISVVENDVTSLVSPIDPLERVLMGDEEESKDEMVEEIEQVLNMSCMYVHGLGIFEELDRPQLVSPVQCVPKKEGMIVVENKINELIPTRTVTGEEFALTTEGSTKQPARTTSHFHSLTRYWTEVFMDDFSVFRSSYDDCLNNMSMVRELYANWNEHQFMSWVQGKEVPLNKASLYKFLGVDCLNPRRLQKFVKCPSYQVIHHTLCDIDSNAKWTRTNGDAYLEMI